jgi:hypothetical protein
MHINVSKYLSINGTIISGKEIKHNKKEAAGKYKKLTTTPCFRTEVRKFLDLEYQQNVHVHGIIKIKF